MRKLIKRYLRAQGIKSTPKLVRESRWMRVYKAGPNLLIYDSKFDEDRLELQASEFKRIWPGLTLDEKLEFCHAYGAKREITKEDEKILNLIMETGDEIIWRNIVSMLTGHPNKARVLKFIRNRVKEQHPPLSNFYQAIETLRDVQSAPHLRKRYQQYLSECGAGPKVDDRELCLDYLYCCKALWKLTGSQEYKQAIRNFLSAHDEVVRNCAKRLLASL